MSSFKPFQAWRLRKQPQSVLAAMRLVMRPLIGIAALHGVLSLLTLVPDEGLFVAGVALAAVQPITAALIIQIGLRLMRAKRRLGRLICGLSAGYLLAGLSAFPLLLIAGLPDPEVFGLAVGFFVAAFMGPAVGVALFLLLFRAAALLLPTWARRAIIAALVLAPILGIAPITSDVLSLTDGLSIWFWVLLPQAYMLLGTLGLWRVLRADKRELAVRRLLDAPTYQALELMDSALPITLRYRVPAAVPFGLHRAAPGAGEPLGNPVLKNLLPLATTDPTQTAALLHGHEDVLLAVLHAWPQATIEKDAVIWRAKISELGDAPVEQTLQRVMEQTRALAALLEGAQPADSLVQDEGR